MQQKRNCLPARHELKYFISDAAPDFLLPEEVPSTIDDVQLRKAVEVMESGS